MTREIEQYWDRQASAFDAIYLNESKLGRRINEMFRRPIYDRFHIAVEESGDVAGKTIVDIGCGSGHYMVEFARRGAGRVIGIDFAASMLELAKRLTAEQGVSDRCTFLAGDYMRMALPEPADVVLAMGVFDYVPEPEAFLRRMVRDSSGKVIASFPRKNRFRMHLRRWRYGLRNCPVYFYSEQDVRRIAEAAGLTEYRTVVMPHGGGGFVLVVDAPAASR